MSQAQDIKAVDMSMGEEEELLPTTQKHEILFLSWTKERKVENLWILKSIQCLALLVLIISIVDFIYTIAELVKKRAPSKEKEWTKDISIGATCLGFLLDLCLSLAYFYSAYAYEKKNYKSSLPLRIIPLEYEQVSSLA